MNETVGYPANTVALPLPQRLTNFCCRNVMCELGIDLFSVEIITRTYSELVLSVFNLRLNCQNLLLSLMNRDIRYDVMQQAAAFKSFLEFSVLLQKLKGQRGMSGLMYYRQ